MANWLDPADIERLASDPVRRMRMPAVDRIDLSRPFLPEDYTQLYYTPVYKSLHRQHRLRYNQLFGVRINEYIMMLEADLVERLLSPLRRHPNVAGNPTLVRCLSTMIEEENHHYRCFVALNRACFPDLYRTRERYFSDLPWQSRALLATAGLLAGRFAFALWYLMAMEESSTALARDLSRNPVTETLGPLEPTFAAVHAEHLKDEVRHLAGRGTVSDLERECPSTDAPFQRLIAERAGDLFTVLLEHHPTRVGPAEQTTTSPPCFSRRRRLSSSA